MNHTRQFRALGLAALTAALTPQAADACGGCFAPPSTVQVVTDHRMVFSVSTTQTTLWDQFSYSGRPAEFSWILPIRYTSRTVVQLASDAFMKGLDDMTAPIVQPPTRPFCSNGFPTGGFADAASAADAAAAPGTPPRASTP